MLNGDEVEKIIRQYLSGVIHMSLGTCADGKPWVCEVHFAFDDGLNLYFRSKASRRHSQEIASNPNVAGNIVEQHGLTDKPRGVYFEGKAEQLKGVDESNIAYQKICERLNCGSEILDEANQEDGHKFYKISVENFYLFDTRESKPSQKYHLAWNKL